MDTIIFNFYRLTVPKNSFKAVWISTLILYTFLNVVRKLEKQNSSLSQFITLLSEILHLPHLNIQISSPRSK
jgi:hypothetical protein